MIPLPRNAMLLINTISHIALVSELEFDSFSWSKVSKKDIPEHLDTLNTIVLMTKILKLRDSEKLANRIKEKLENTSHSPLNFREFINSIRELDSRVKDELENITFGFIPINKAEYFENEKLFGNDVYDKFPDAREEIKEAGNCFANGLNTACVFHLMRAAEIAVKEMYMQMTDRKKLIYGKDKAGDALSKPIELCDWRTLITGLNLALSELEKGKSKSLAKSKKHSFYSEAIGIFGNMKDGWRNTISHGNEINHGTKRKLFNAGETEDIIRDAKRFMARIALQIK